IASGSSDATVRVWDAASGELLRTLEDHGGWVYSVAWSPDGRYIASGSRDATVRVWDVRNSEEVVVKELGSSVNSVDWAAVGGKDVVVAGLANGDIVLIFL
ncbi:MAG: hypothetical protein J7L07_10090, partial [Candidatus Odinarchaeota archaeon]|nr:hypothetical protein [Candidatus Odinarchaeota archaeon]